MILYRECVIRSEGLGYTWMDTAGVVQGTGTMAECVEQIDEYRDGLGFAERDFDRELDELEPK